MLRLSWSRTGVKPRAIPYLWPVASSLSLLPSPFSTSRRVLKSQNDHNRDSANVGHASFIAEAPKSAEWKEPAKGHLLEEETNDLEGVGPGRGKITPTSSHLFKLILPLPGPSTKAPKAQPPTVFLLHPSQPLSHISRLMWPSLATRSPTISFRSSARASSFTNEDAGEVQWSDSTDIGDFVKAAARSTQFSIVITGSEVAKDESKKIPDPAEEHSHPPPPAPESDVIVVTVPTFKSRTRFLRRRLGSLGVALTNMEDIKTQCDRDAHRGARRMAVSGLGMLIVYWGTVTRLTFWDSYSREIMEPVTYLSGLSTVILGYLWFLYQGREVSYSSVLDRSISTRRAQLYKSRGLDVDKWSEMVLEEKALRKEVTKIAEDYGVEIDHQGEEIISSMSASSKPKLSNGASKDSTKAKGGGDKHSGKDDDKEPPERDVAAKSP